jgi:YidC/Oxa1 family membrane protein insertase
MDKNTLIGLGLIGVILAVFTYINQPDPEEIRRQQEIAQQELEERKRLEESEAAEQIKDLQNALPENWVPVLGEDGTQQIDSLGNAVFRDTVRNVDSVLVNTAEVQTAQETRLRTSTQDFQAETLMLKNKNLTVTINTLGGGVQKVLLNQHQTYENFAVLRGTDSIVPMVLFDSEVSTNQLVFPYKGDMIQLGNKGFEVVRASNELIELRHVVDAGKSISYIYSILPDNYHIRYEIKMNGFAGDVTPENVMLHWQTDLKQTERLLSEQRRVSTIFFKGVGKGYDYLSEMSNDDLKPDVDLDWVAFKQSYFSAILIPEKPFSQNGSKLEVVNYEESDERYDSHIKNYEANLNLNLTNTGDGSVAMNWFFGPNDYYLLASYGNEMEDIVNLGWGIFRWVNIYAIQPIFTYLANTGMNLGIAILLLTIFVKLVLTPIQWKMYTSSAKMRILKPEIDELNKKYPNKEDGMKKQMEMMTLYRESGASPLAGCVPMLIQMPILFAVFRFFPSTFDLRQQSFLWAEDLSSFDSIASLPFNVPFYGDHVSLFTLLMAGTTLVYTILNSSNMQTPTQPGMPNMKVIMYIFPIMMIFFFNNFASGLSYYYFLSTLVSILTMIMIKEFFVDEEKLKAKMAAKKAQNQKGGGKGKKSKFQERLEQMQKMQQEKMKQKNKR